MGIFKLLALSATNTTFRITNRRNFLNTFFIITIGRRRITRAGLRFDLTFNDDFRGVPLLSFPRIQGKIKHVLGILEVLIIIQIGFDFHTGSESPAFRTDYDCVPFTSGCPIDTLRQMFHPTGWKPWIRHDYRFAGAVARFNCRLDPNRTSIFPARSITAR